MFNLNKRKDNVIRFKRILVSMLSFILCISFCFSLCSCRKRNDNAVSSKISIAEESGSISAKEEASSLIAKTESEVGNTSSVVLKQPVSSSVTQTNSVSISQGNVAQTGVFDVYAEAPSWTYSVDKSKPVPLQPCVDNSFFKDVLFVGDSITTGIDLYNIVSGCGVVAYTGINTSTILSKAVIRNNQGVKVTFLQAMSQYNPKHIFIMLGINGIAFQSKDNFLAGYRQFVDAVKAQHPNSVIYLQSILPVTNKKQNADQRFANSKINSYNEGIQALALEKNVYYLNVAEAFKDEYGNLPSKASSDGIHFGPAHYRLWIEYLKRHTIYTGVIPQEPVVSTPATSNSSTSIPAVSQPAVSQPVSSSSVSSSETSSRQILISRPEMDDNYGTTSS